MPPRKKRIRSDDSENSTVDSKGPSSGSDAQKPGSLRNLRHQSKKINSEDYDGDCELERHDKNRVTKTATRSRILKQKLSNNLNSDSSSSTPVAQMDVDDYFGFENMTTPVPCSPVPHLSIANTKDTPGEVTGPKGSPAVTQMTKTIFETPVEKPVKRFKRKRVSRVRQGAGRQHLIKMVRDPKPSPVKQVDEEVQDMCDKVKEVVQEKTSKTFPEFKASSYRTLVDYVNSRIIVFIKVRINESGYIHLRLFRKIPSNHGEVTFEQLLDEKKESDPLDAFEPMKTES